MVSCPFKVESKRHNDLYWKEDWRRWKILMSKTWEEDYPDDRLDEFNSKYWEDYMACDQRDMKECVGEDSCPIMKK